MQETKVTLIYWGLSLFVFFALIPWIFNPVFSYKIYSSIINLWRYYCCFFGRHNLGLEKKEHASSKNLWIAIGFSILGLLIALTTFINLTTSLALLILSLHAFLRFEKQNSEYFQLNIKYANARNLITNLVTICCITSIAFLNNPYT